MDPDRGYPDLHEHLRTLDEDLGRARAAQAAAAIGVAAWFSAPIGDSLPQRDEAAASDLKLASSPAQPTT